MIAPNAYPGPPGIIGPKQGNTVHRPWAPTGIRVVAITSYITLLAVTPDIPAADRQSFYGSFTRDICDKYLTVFGDFKYHPLLF